MTQGLSNLLATGKGTFNLLDIKRCAGLLSLPSVSVFLHWSMAFQKSFPSHIALLHRLFTILITDSALQLAFGCHGVEVRCSNSHLMVMRLNCSHATRGSLSEITWSS